MGGDATYRVVTDPSEGPKAFTIQTRVTSRGELAVIMMGVDCAERIMLHESVGFDLPEDAFVFKLGPGTAGVLDQLLYKWAHSREAVTPALTDGYLRLMRAGWEVSEEDVQRDVSLLFGGSFEAFLAK